MLKKRRLFIKVRRKYPNIHRVVESPSLEEYKERVDVALRALIWVTRWDWSQAGLNLGGLSQPQGFYIWNNLSSNH